MRVKSAAAFLLALLGFWPGTVGAQNRPTAEAGVRADSRLDRLVTLAEVWGRAYLFHPEVASDPDLDWEKVLLDAIPACEAEDSIAGFGSALNHKVVARLDDPRAFVAIRSQDVARLQSPLADTDVYRYIDLREAGKYRAPDFLDRLHAELSGAIDLGHSVLDLRWLSDPPSGAEGPVTLLLGNEPLVTGAWISRVHYGWNESNAPSVYSQRWMVTPGRPVRRPENYSLLPLRSPVVVLVNRVSLVRLEDLLDVLQADGRIRVVFDATSATGAPAGEKLRFANGLEAWIPDRVLLSQSGGFGLRPLTVHEGELTSVLSSRLTPIADSPRGRPSFRSHFRMHFPPGEQWNNRPLNREERIAALIKVWTVIRRLDPHLEFAAEPWGRTLLRKWLPKVETAANNYEFFSLLRELAAGLNDGHADAHHPSTITGWYTFPARVLPVEGRAVVTELYPGLETFGLQVGDEILAIDDVPVHQYEQDREKLVSASNHVSKLMKIYYFNHEKDSPAQLRLRRGATETTVSVRRSLQVQGLLRASWGEPVRDLPGNMMYVDLTALADQRALDAALEKSHGKHGLVFDLRGYPQYFITLDLVSRIVGIPVTSTVFEVPVMAGAAQTHGWSISTYTTEPVRSAATDVPFVVLVDERTWSMPEDISIYLRNAGRGTFVGSRTAGANGNQTGIRLPGGGIFTFTGMRVRYADGRAFQNDGIRPDLDVSPTIDGVRAGRDEVLEEAVKALHLGLRVRPPALQD